MEYQDILDGLNSKIVHLALPSHLWDSLPASTKHIIKKNKWKTFKFFVNSKKNNICIDKINHHIGGIYIFFIWPKTIPKNHKIIMYVGRAHLTDSQNLRKRISEYYGYAPPSHERPKISRMIAQWSEYLYCSYLELDYTNDIIDVIEKDLINYNLFPFNDDIPDTTIGDAVKAAGLQ